MKLAAHVAANILAIGALSVAAGSAQKSGDASSPDIGVSLSKTAQDAPRHSLAIRASRNEDRWLPPTTTTTSAPIPNVATAKSPNRNGKVSHSPATSATAPGDAKMFIYNKESTNNPCAYYPGKSDCNYTGHAACGLGGANPCDKLRVVCLLSDYACQDDWFTNRYMIPRYGTWANAKAFWIGHGYW